MADEKKLISLFHKDEDAEFFVELIPQKIGCFGIELEYSYRARIKLVGESKGGLSAKHAIEQLQKLAGWLSVATFEIEGDDD